MVTCLVAIVKKRRRLAKDAALGDLTIVKLAGTTAGAAATAALVSATAVGAAAAGRAATAASNRIFGFNNKTIVGHVDLHVSGLGLQFFVDKEGESTSLKYFVFVVRLIQSQGQAWACSATCREIYADGGRVFILEVAVELLLSGFCNFKH